MFKNCLSKYVLFVLCFSLVGITYAQKNLNKGDGKLVIQNDNLIGGQPMNIYYHVPQKYNKNSRVLFVMHGNSRNPKTYRKQWINFSEKYNALLVCPDFSHELFPKDQNYNMGNMFKMNDDDEIEGNKDINVWSFSMVEAIFDKVVQESGNNSKGYYIYGHSAGSQFVHRFFTFVPEARIIKAVFANAGWYTMPDFSLDFPYGLKGTTSTRIRLKNMFNKNIVVLLGTKDINANHKSLRRTAEAMEQGPYRLARGKKYFLTAAKLAANNNFDFNWKLKFVPGVGHHNKDMAESAAESLFNSN